MESFEECVEKILDHYNSEGGSVTAFSRDLIKVMRCPSTNLLLFLLGLYGESIDLYGESIENIEREKQKEIKSILKQEVLMQTRTV